MNTPTEVHLFRMQYHCERLDQVNAIEVRQQANDWIDRKVGSLYQRKYTLLLADALEELLSSDRQMLMRVVRDMTVVLKQVAEVLRLDPAALDYNEKRREALEKLVKTFPFDGDALAD